MLAPATRLMDQLRYPKKFLLVSTLFAIPTLLLLMFVWLAGHDDIKFAQQEQRGVALLEIITPLWQQSLQTGDGARINGDLLSALKAANQAHGEALQLSEPINKLISQASLGAAAQGQVSAAALALISQLNDNSNLVLDPETASYYVGDLIISKLPSLLDTLHHAQSELIGGHFEQQKSQLILLSAPDRLTETMAQMSSSIDKITVVEPQVGAILKTQWAPLATQLNAYLARYQQHIVQPLQSQQVPHPESTQFTALNLQIAQSASNLNSTGFTQLSGLLAERIHSRQIKLAFAFGVALIAFLSAAWLLAGFYLSTKRNLERLKTSFQNVADGKFADPIILDGKDELAELNTGLSQLVRNLRDFSQEQIAMANAHEDGDIHHTLPSEKFNGGYREMAERVNELVRSHTGIEMKMAALTSLYTQGEYSLQMENMKGLKSMISTEIDHVRERMQQAAQDADFTLRVKQALDQVSTPVQIADRDGRIIYYNLASDANFTLRAGLAHPSALSNYPLSQLLHSNSKLQGITEQTRNGDVQLGDGRYTVTLSPIRDAHDQIVGQVVEWQDRTAELATASEIAELVISAANGDLSGRIDLNGKTGFFAELGQNLNQLISTNEQGLNDISQILSALAHGDLTQHMTGQRSGIFDELQHNANTTIAQLSQIISEIRGASSAVAETVNSLVSGNTELAERSRRQAESSERTAQTATEISSMVKRNAETTAAASQLAKQASSQANQGRETMDRVTAAMARLTQSARQIADITSLIDGIAFQTNILALNAAVEAARAGDSGRGFAVVAAEVRNLAQRSASAAKEIKALIDTSVTEIHQGHQLATQSASQVHGVVEQVSSLTHMLQEIDNASREQSLGVDDMSQSIAAIDTDVQENRALSNRLSQNSSEMRTQALRLDSAISVFQTH
ncbi:HAMP domain-containing protein [Chitinibacter bivalviorum]|uniref:HAMP domain-containing protein n=1 Tax=Chitinibacter bivalviorum TaxID=2739434 RepID=A0A7H9BKX2_9NEIS|nr:methyl-accepting chemotaxis protein [Chitinibacter bivalviorum]QLG89327.1 HAMP domain-containing protein [Chitinibacter bivalviorum]